MIIEADIETVLKIRVEMLSKRYSGDGAGSRTSDNNIDIKAESKAKLGKNIQRRISRLTYSSLCYASVDFRVKDVLPAVCL